MFSRPVDNEIANNTQVPLQPLEQVQPIRASQTSTGFTVPVNSGSGSRVTVTSGSGNNTSTQTMFQSGNGSTFVVGNNTVSNSNVGSGSSVTVTSRSGNNTSTQTMFQSGNGSTFTVTDGSGKMIYGDVKSDPGSYALTYQVQPLS